MRILQLALTADDGTPQRLGRELRARGLECEVAIIGRGDFPRDSVHEHVDPSWGLLRHLIDWADLLHVQGFCAYAVLRKELGGKSFLVHARSHSEHSKGLSPNFPHVVSTPALLRELPEAVLIPDLISSKHDIPARAVLRWRLTHATELLSDLPDIRRQLLDEVLTL